MVYKETCKYLDNSHCRLVEELTSIPCPVTNECLHCTQDINLTTITLASRLTPERTYDISNLGNGFGTRLHNLLSPFLSEVPECECREHKDILDLWTEEYIKQNIDRVVSWLATEARRRRLPFSYRLTRILLLKLL